MFARPSAFSYTPALAHLLPSKPMVKEYHPLCNPLTPNVICGRNASTPPNLPTPASSAEAKCVLGLFHRSPDRYRSLGGPPDETPTHGFFISMYGGVSMSGGGRIEMKLDEGWVKTFPLFDVYDWILWTPFRCIFDEGECRAECIYNRTRFLGFPFRRLSSALSSCFKPLDDVTVCPRLASSSSWRAFPVAWRT